MMNEQFKGRARGSDDMHPNTSARLFTAALLVRNQVPAGRARRYRYGVLLVASLCTCFPGVALAGEFFGLGDLPGGTFHSSANGVSADGSVVVGESLVADLEPFIWTSGGGMVGLGVAGYAAAVSGDGNTVVGAYATAGHTEAFRWTSGGGVVGLGVGGYVNSWAHAVSSDGSVTVGHVAGAGTSNAFRWTEGAGMELLGWFSSGGTPQSIATGVSDTGTIVGYAGRLGGGAEAFYLTPSSVALEGLGHLAGGNISRAAAITPDGQFIVGTSNDVADVFQPVRWTLGAGGYAIESLGLLGGWDNADALSVSADGAIVVGQAQTSGGQFQAFRWSSDSGMQKLQDWLASSGVNVGAWKLEAANAISADGNTIVGYGTNPNGDTEAFLARGGALIGVMDFSNSVASLRAVSHLPAEVARASIVNEVPGLYGLSGFSAAPVYQHVSGSRGDLAGAGFTWRQPGIAISGQAGAVRAGTSELYDGGRANYQGWWLGAAASLGAGALLDQPALTGLELDVALRIGRDDVNIDRNYLNGVTVETAHGDTQSRTVAALARLGWRHAISPDLTVLPYVQLLHSRVVVDGYDETGASMAGTVSSQTSSSLDMGVGMAAAWNIRPDLQLRFRYGVNYLNDDRGAPVTVAVPGLGTFAHAGSKYDRTWHEAGVAADWAVAERTRLNVSANETFGSNYPEAWSLSMAINVGF